MLTSHEQYYKKKKNLSLGVRLENGRNKKYFHCCCFQVGGNNYLGGGKGRGAFLAPWKNSMFILLKLDH